MSTFAYRPTTSPRRGRRRRLAIIAAIAALAMPTQAANAGASLSTATPLLVVDGFHGTFAPNAYQPAPGDVVDGVLTRASGTETIGATRRYVRAATQVSTSNHPRLQTAVWSSRRLPSAPLPGCRRRPDRHWRDGVLRYRPDDSYITEFGGTKTMAAYGIPSATYRHMALVYQAATVAAYVLTAPRSAPKPRARRPAL